MPPQLNQRSLIRDLQWTIEKGYCGRRNEFCEHRKKQREKNERGSVEGRRLSIILIEACFWPFLYMAFPFKKARQCFGPDEPNLGRNQVFLRQSKDINKTRLEIAFNTVSEG